MGRLTGPDDFRRELTIEELRGSRARWMAAAIVLGALLFLVVLTVLTS